MGWAGGSLPALFPATRFPYSAASSSRIFVGLAAICREQDIVEQGRNVRSRALHWRLSVGVALAIAGFQAPAGAQVVSPEQLLLR